MTLSADRRRVTTAEDILAKNTATATRSLSFAEYSMGFPSFKLICSCLLLLVLPFVSANWWYCASEGGYCDRPGRIRYGASGRYHYGNGPRRCDNSNFGNPHYRQRKHCWSSSPPYPPCSPGTAGNPGSCIDCTPGRYQDQSGQGSCKNCGSGQYQDENKKTDCKSCDIGRSSGSAQSTCSDCATGLYQDQTGQSSCKGCSAGTFQAATGKTSCDDCVPGQYSTGSASICTACETGKFQDVGKQPACKDCNPGQFQTQTGQTGCTECIKGQYSNSGANKCEDCQKGKYSDEKGKASCDNCLPGKYNAYTGALTETKCLHCQTGRYSNVEGATSDDTCQACVPGKYADQTASSVCTDCPNGRASPTTAAPNLNNCIVCLAGKISSEDHTQCTDCNPGLYKEGAGDGPCLNCQTCEIGKVREGCGGKSRGSCPFCAQGFYKNIVGNWDTTCTRCGDGKTNSGDANADGKSGLGKHLGCEFCKPPFAGTQGLCNVKCDENFEYPNEVRTACRKVKSASIVNKSLSGYHPHNLTRVQWTSENLETDRFTIKVCPRAYEMRKKSQQCESNNIMFGEDFTFTECAMRCSSDEACLAFLYGKGAKAGVCIKETTLSVDCTEGFAMDNEFDYYVDNGPNCTSPIAEADGTVVRAGSIDYEASTKMYSYDITVPATGTKCVKEDSNWVIKIGYDYSYDAVYSDILLMDQVHTYSDIFLINENIKPRLQPSDIEILPTTVYVSTPLLGCHASDDNIIDYDSLRSDLSFTGYEFEIGTGNTQQSSWTTLATTPGGNQKGVARPYNDTSWDFIPSDNYVRCKVKCFDKCQEGAYIPGPSRQVVAFPLSVSSGPASGGTVINVTGDGFLMKSPYTCKWKSMVDGGNVEVQGVSTSFENVRCTTPPFYFSSGPSLVTIDGPVLRYKGCYLHHAAIFGNFFTIKQGSIGVYTCLKLCREGIVPNEQLDHIIIATRGNECACAKPGTTTNGMETKDEQFCNKPCSSNGATDAESMADKAQGQQCGGEWIENGSQQKTAWSLYESEKLHGMKASKFDIAPVVPGNVTSLRLVSIRGGIQVYFDPPPFKGGTLDTSQFEYEIRYDILNSNAMIADDTEMEYDYGGPSKIIVLSKPSELSLNIPYLQPRQAYSVQIRCKNNEGYGPWTNILPSSKIEPEVAEKPTRVRNIRVTKVGPYDVTLQFEAPIYDGGAYLSSYTVYHQAETEDGCLTPEKAYVFNVTSITDKAVHRAAISYVKDPVRTETVKIVNLTAESLNFFQISAMNAKRLSSGNAPPSQLAVRTPAETTPKNVSSMLNSSIGDDRTCVPQCASFDGAFNFTMKIQKKAGQVLQLLPGTHKVQTGPLKFTVSNVEIIGLARGACFKADDHLCQKDNSGQDPGCGQVCDTDSDCSFGTCQYKGVIIDCSRTQCFRSGENLRDGNPVFASRFEKLTITNAYADEKGAAMLLQNVAHRVVLKDIRITESFSVKGGSAIALIECTDQIVMQGSFFFHLGVNKKEGQTMEEAKAQLDYSKFGGAIMVINSASVIFKDVHMRGNFAQNGGHIAIVPWGKLGEKSLSGLNTKTAVIIRDSLLEGSFALDSGAGIYSWGANIQLHDSRVENCQAKIGGGGIGLYSSECLINSTKMNQNAVLSGNGAAVAAWSSTLNIEKGYFEWNAADNGGAVSAVQSPVFISETTFVNNAATSSGGAVYFGADAEPYVKDSLFDDNKANGRTGNDGGGGIYLDNTRSAEIRNTKFTKCYADNGGGGMYLYKSMKTTIDGEFLECHTDGNAGGGAILINIADIKYKNVQVLPSRPSIYAKFFGNTAKYSGGGAVMWTAAAENIATMPDGYPILFYGYGNGVSPKAYNNTALYGNFVASTVANLFLQSGPTSIPGGILAMQGLESCQSSSTRCPDECDTTSNQCPTWVKRKHDPTTSGSYEDSGKTFRNPFKVLLLDYYNQQVLGEVGKSIVVKVQSTTVLDATFCGSINRARHDGTTCLFGFEKGSGSKAAVAGFVDFYTLAVLAKPLDKALSFMITAPSATTHKAYPPASVMLNNCKRGEYYDYISTTCMACPRGKFSNTINHNIENYEGDCISCSPGKYAPSTNATECLECPTGRYQTSHGKHFCQSCELGRWTNNTISHALQCLDCPKGRHGSRTEKGAGSCIDCEPGKYMNKEGATQCKKCDSGFYSSFVGHVECNICKAGKASAEGSTECTFDCAAGKYKRDDQTSCRLCQPGRSTNGLVGQSECLACEAGKFSTSGNPTCKLCPVGTEAPEDGQADLCRPCPAGRYTNLKGTANCTACEKGTYNTEYSYARGDVLPRNCKSCTAGLYTENQAGRSYCSKCPPGYRGVISTDTTREVNQNYGNCEMCSFDTANPFYGKIKCDECNVSTWTERKLGQTSCIDCIEGEIYPITGSNTECRMCQGPDPDNPSDRGTYSFFAGDTTRDVCNECPAGATCIGGNKLRQDWGWWASKGLETKKRDINNLGLLPQARQCGDVCTKNDPDCVCTIPEGQLKEKCIITCDQDIYSRGEYMDRNGVKSAITRCPGYEKYITCEDVLSRASTSNTSTHNFDWRGTSIILNDYSYASLPDSCQACRETEFRGIKQEEELTQKVQVEFRIKGNSKTFLEILDMSDTRVKYMRTLGNHSFVPCNFMAGYSGRLCQNCMKGFARDGRYSCMICPPLEYSYGMAVFGAIGGTVGVILFIRIVMQDAGSTSTAGSMKRILINYMQVVSICSYFDLNWSPAAMELFRLQGLVSSVSDKLLNMDCILNMYEDQLAIRPYYCKLLLYAGVPLICLLTSQFYWFWVAFKQCICGDKILKAKKNAKVQEESLRLSDMKKDLAKSRWKGAKQNIQQINGQAAIKNDILSVARNKRMKQISKEAHYLSRQLRRSGIADPSAINQDLADYEAVGRLRARQMMQHVRAKGIDLNAAFNKYDPQRIGEIDIADFVKMLHEDFKLGWPEEDYICLGELFDGQSKDGRVELTNILSYDKTPMDKAMLCATVIIYLLYPTIARSMFTSLSCKFSLEDGNSFAYLEYDLESPCYDATHIWFLLMIVIPSLGLYTFAFPIMGVIVLKRNIAKYGWANDTVMYRYSLLMSGYRREFWYWEIVISARKVILVGIAVFMGNYGTETQFFCAVLVIVISLALQVHYRPMANDLLNQVENASLGTLFLTLYLGLLFFWDTVVGPGRDILALSLIGLNSAFTLWCMGTILTQWAARHGGSRVNKCLEKVDNKSAIVSILIVVPALLYLVVLGIIGAFGCTRCCGCEEDPAKQHKKLNDGINDGIRDFSFEEPTNSASGRFRNKRTTFSNPRVQEQFINQSIKQREFLQQNMKRDQDNARMRLNKRREVSRSKMQPLGMSSISQGGIEMSRVAAPPTLNLSPKSTQILNAKKVSPLSTEGNAPKIQEKTSIVQPPTINNKQSMIVDIDATIDAEEVPQEVLRNNTAQEQQHEVTEDDGLSLISELGLHEDTDLSEMMEPQNSNNAPDTYEL